MIRVASADVEFGALGAQQGGETPDCIEAGPLHSHVHSQTLPIMSYTPYPLGKRADRRGPGKPIEHEVLPRKPSLPRIGHPPPVGLLLVTPPKPGPL